jgi:hypothetical protein
LTTTPILNCTCGLVIVSADELDPLSGLCRQCEAFSLEEVCVCLDCEAIRELTQ